MGGSDIDGCGEAFFADQSPRSTRWKSSSKCCVLNSNISVSSSAIIWCSVPGGTWKESPVPGRSRRRPACRGAVQDARPPALTIERLRLQTW